MRQQEELMLIERQNREKMEMQRLERAREEQRCVIVDCCRVMLTR